MTQELIGELYRSYMRGDLTLEQAAEQIFALIMEGQEGPAGLSVITGAMNATDQERTFALFDRLKWHTLREVLPEADIPAPDTGDFLADLEDFEDDNDTG